MIKRCLFVVLITIAISHAITIHFEEQNKVLKNAAIQGRYYKDGLGIAGAIKVKNNNHFLIRSFEISCKFLDSNGHLVNDSVRKIDEAIAPEQTVTIKKINVLLFGDAHETTCKTTGIEK